MSYLNSTLFVFELTFGRSTSKSTFEGLFQKLIHLSLHQSRWKSNLVLLQSRFIQNLALRPRCRQFCWSFQSLAYLLNWFQARPVHFSQALSQSLLLRHTFLSFLFKILGLLNQFDQTKCLQYFKFRPFYETRLVLCAPRG